MLLDIPISEDLERQLRAQTPDFDTAVRESVLVTLFRQGQLTHKQFAESLGLDRWQAEALLRKHNVTEDLPTIEEIREQVKLAGDIRSQA
jgi:hypothetical protein